ncbi:MAG: hypothetical protein SCABRO_02189 [Candidatus Scalindua brodae]|uniref:Uncharacterized protein n=1 Tax=Candidatus Scalindua brodae TaxID=237368 RepID=A0A0B0EG50_9BACT|nr:MAG: hypothetical protein SCABRO_02189 [Candidatus Scalindua brodae]
MRSFVRARKVRLLYLIIASLFCLRIGFSSASPGIEPEALESDKFSGIDFKNGLLKVSVEKQNFNEILYNVAEKAGIKMILYCPADKKLTAGFDYLPLEKGLRLLLEDYNFVFKYHSGEDDLSKSTSHLAKVFVISRLKDPTFAETLGIGGIDQEALYERIMKTVKVKELEMMIKERFESDTLTTTQNSSSQVGNIEKVLIEKIKEIGGVKNLKKTCNRKVTKSHTCY